MMTSLRLWFASIVAVSFLTALAERLTPEGGAKRIQRVCCGLVWLIVALRPALSSFSADSLPSVSAVSRAIESREELLREKNDASLCAVIAEKTEAYIEARAEERDMSCTAAVEVRLSDDGDFCEISGVTLTGTPDGDFTTLVSGELGLAPESIHWKERDK